MCTWLQSEHRFNDVSNRFPAKLPRWSRCGIFTVLRHLSCEACRALLKKWKVEIDGKLSAAVFLFCLSCAEQAKDLHDSRSLNWCQANSPGSCKQWNSSIKWVSIHLWRNASWLGNRQSCKPRIRFLFAARSFYPNGPAERTRLGFCLATSAQSSKGEIFLWCILHATGIAVGVERHRN